MGSKSLNQVLAEVLRAELSRRQLSNKKLATMSRVAEGTIRNYLAGDDPQHTSTGKERSAKLTEVERIAVALGLHPLALLTDPTEQRARVEAMALAAAEAAASYNVAVEPLPAQAPAASFGKLPQRAA